uniref:Uncharacterized protein n=1 Tax=Oryza punctata TaxID=4537 RepID=A0A0E0LZ68_ORYPU
MGHLLLPPPPPHSSELKLVKIKHLFHAFVLKHGGRLAAALGGAAKALLLTIAARGSIARLRNKTRRRKKNTKKPRCRGGDGDAMMTMQLKLQLPAVAVPPSSEIGGVIEPFDAELAYYDSSWNTMIPAEEQLLRPITGYLSWPEQEEEDDDQGEEEEDEKNEIDRLADKFIARCHERFILEKQESYRRFHEMLARSL